MKAMLYKVMCLRTLDLKCTEMMEKILFHRRISFKCEHLTLMVLLGFSFIGAASIQTLNTLQKVI